MGRGNALGPDLETEARMYSSNSCGTPWRLSRRRPEYQDLPRARKSYHNSPPFQKETGALGKARHYEPSLPAGWLRAPKGNPPPTTRPSSMSAEVMGKPKPHHSSNNDCKSSTPKGSCRTETVS